MSDVIVSGDNRSRVCRLNHRRSRGPRRCGERGIPDVRVADVPFLEKRQRLGRRGKSAEQSLMINSGAFALTLAVSVRAGDEPNRVSRFMTHRLSH